ncbi:MAG: hydrogenase maturation nickel metallochaperone HypA [Candidatus Methanomethylophilaceae archaeon]
MHEVSVISDIVNAVLEKLEEYNVESVKSVEIVVGDMTQLGEEQLSFAYEVVTRGTILENSELVIEREPIEVECKGCGYSGPVKVIESGDYVSHSIPILSCPECGGKIKVVAGQSCRIKSLEITEAC